MNPTETNSPQKEPGEATAFAAWGTLIGAGAGTLVGLLAGHWGAWTVALGCAGLIAGALKDRSRR